MSTGDPICLVCGNYKLQCTCANTIRTTMNFNELKYKAANFSDKTFGKNNPITGPLTHIHEEIDEILLCLSQDEDPLDEFADVLLMLVDAFRKHYGDSVDMQILIDAASKKLDINETRKWGEPDENGVIKHIKE